jgi:hypothetical protein
MEGQELILQFLISKVVDIKSWPWADWNGFA